MKKIVLKQNCTGFFYFNFNIFVICFYITLRFFYFSVYIKQHPRCANPLDGFKRGGLSKNIQKRVQTHRTNEAQFMTLDDDSERDEFDIYQLVTDVPEAMARLIEEKLNSSKGIHNLDFYFFFVY